jgi:biopolymer transport protein ExbD
MAKRKEVDTELNITSMMDMMTIILVFLLKSFGATEITVKPSENMKLPLSSAREDPAVAISVVVQKDIIVVDNLKVLDLEAYMDPALNQQIFKVPASEKQGNVIPKLYEAFTVATEKAKKMQELAEERDDMKFTGRVLLQIDKDIPFSLVRDVMFNAGQAQFAEFEFVVIKGGSD